MTENTSDSLYFDKVMCQWTDLFFPKVSQICIIGLSIINIVTMKDLFRNEKAAKRIILQYITRLQVSYMYIFPVILRR